MRCSVVQRDELGRADKTEITLKSAQNLASSLNSWQDQQVFLLHLMNIYKKMFKTVYLTDQQVANKSILRAYINVGLGKPIGAKMGKWAG